jgi:hypothetical protein
MRRSLVEGVAAPAAPMLQPTGILASGLADPVTDRALPQKHML